MKKIISFPILILLASTTALFGQTINLSADSVTTLLCKKWTVDHAIMGGANIGKLPNAPEINYEFKNDKTVVFTGNNPKDVMKADWAYVPSKKLIKLTPNVKSNSNTVLNIISLKEDELIILMGSSQPGPNDPPEIQLVCRIKAN
jgi:hypothetical protein